MSETPWEAPAEDVAEQRAAVRPDDDTRTPLPTSERWEVDPADAAEQDEEVPLDDEDRR